MAAMRRFISRGESWTNGAVVLDRGGKEFDEEKDGALIASIVKDGVLAGGLVIESPSLRQLTQTAEIESAKPRKKTQKNSGRQELDAETWARQAGTDLAAMDESGATKQKKRSDRGKSNG